MERIGLSTSTWKASAYVARTFVDRLLGFRRAPAGAAVVINARSVHGFGLRRPLAVVGLDARMKVVATATLRAQPGGRVSLRPHHRRVAAGPSAPGAGRLGRGDP